MTPEIRTSDKELSTAYSPNEVEEKWYPVWEKSGAYMPSENGTDSFTLMIPPPNVTGILTMGHVLNNTINIYNNLFIYIYSLHSSR